MGKKWKCYWGIVVICLFFLPALSTHAADANTVYRSLAIGRGSYSGGNSLSQGPENDAKNFARVLKASYGIDTEMHVEELASAVTTLARLKSEIQDAFAGADANDVNYFYYSGHGSGGGTLSLGNESVGGDQLASCFEGIQGKNILVIDCCFSGALISKSARQEVSLEEKFLDTFLGAFQQTVESQKKSRSALNTSSFHVLTAASAEELSWQAELALDGASNNQEKSVGFFTSALTLGAGINPFQVNRDSGYSFGELPGDFNRNGQISFNEIYKFIKNENICNQVRMYPESSEEIFVASNQKNAPKVIFTEMSVAYDNGAPVLNIAYEAQNDANVTCIYYGGDWWELGQTMDNSFGNIPNYSNWFRKTITFASGKHTKQIMLPLNGESIAGGNYTMFFQVPGQEFNYRLFFAATAVDSDFLNNYMLTGESGNYVLNLDKEFEIKADFGQGVTYTTLPYVTCDIYSGATLVNTLVNNELIDAVGQNYNDAIDNFDKYNYYKKIYWNGKDSAGTYVKPGTYKARVRATLGTKTVEKTVEMKVSYDTSFLTGIFIKKQPSKTKYIVGESFNKAGMVVVADYGVLGQVEVTDYQVKDATLVLGQKSVTITYNKKTVQVPITVSEKEVTPPKETETEKSTEAEKPAVTVTGITIVKKPKKTVYKAGESFNKAGMVVNIVYSNGAKKPTTKYTVNKKVLKMGDKFVTLTYQKKTTKLPITVKEVKAKTLTVKTKLETIKNKGLTLGVKEKVQLNCVIAPSNTTYKTLTYKSSKTSVATISAKGLITAKKAGTTKITVTTKNNLKKTFTVTVKKAPTGISYIVNKEAVKKKTIKKNQSFTLKPTLSKGAASYVITYSSSNKKIVSVGPKGKVTGLKNGKATVTVKTYNGKKCKITITVK